MRAWLTIAGGAWLVVALAIAWGACGAVSAQVDSDRGQIEIGVELPPHGPFEREMILLRIRSDFEDKVALQELEHPPLSDVSWIQLGKDEWSRTNRDGRQVLRCERLLAVFPQRQGPLSIGSFIHHATIIGQDGERREIALTSEPLEIAVRPWAQSRGGPGSDGDWWLPAHSLVVTDHWEPMPEQLPLRASTRRTVTIEAAGVTAEHLPPGFDLSSPDRIVFARPVERRTELGPGGPVARAVYRWDIRPRSGAPVTLDAIAIPWFNIQAREMEAAEIPARQLAFATTDAGEPAGRPVREAFDPWVLGAGIASFFAAAGLLLGGSGGTRTSLPTCVRRWRIDRARLRPLRHAGRRKDAVAVRAGIDALARSAPDRWERCASDPAIAQGLRKLDQHLFGAAVDAAIPDAARLARAVSRAWRCSFQQWP